MATIKQFTSLASNQVNKGIYVWGAQGQLLTSISPEWIRSKETSTANANKAIEMYNKRKGIAGARAYDCSGLVCWCLTECKAKEQGFDKTAEGLRQLCSKLSKPTEDGDLCFKISDGKAHHVGMYVGGKIVEAKGRAYGVVSSSVSSSWNAFGRLPIKWDDEPKGYVLTRILKKGCKGDDVKELQKKLMSLGYKLPKYGADGDFGKETDKYVRQFQVDKKLKADGIVGKNTCEKLGWIWKG
jgi:hypothetical protein